MPVTRPALLLLVAVSVTAGCSLGPSGSSAGSASPASSTASPSPTPLPDAAEFDHAQQWSPGGPTDASAVVAASRRFFERGRYRAELTADVRVRGDGVDEDDERLRLRAVLVNGSRARYETGGSGEPGEDRTFGGDRYVARDGTAAGVVRYRRTVLGVTTAGSAAGRAAVRGADVELDPEPVATVVPYAVVGDYRSATVVERNGTAMVRYRIDGVNAAAAREFDAERFDLAGSALFGLVEGNASQFAPEVFRGTVTVDRRGRVRRTNLTVVRTVAAADGNVTVEMDLQYRLTDVGTATAPRPDWVGETPVLQVRRIDDPGYDGTVLAVEHVAGPPVRPAKDGHGLGVRVLPRATDGEVLLGDYYEATAELPEDVTLGPNTTLYVYGTGTEQAAGYSVGTKPDPDAVAAFDFGFRTSGPAVVGVEPAPGDVSATYYAAVDER